MRAQEADGPEKRDLSMIESLTVGHDILGLSRDRVVSVGLEVGLTCDASTIQPERASDRASPGCLAEILSWV
jgi:hypothetical protein